MNRYRIETRDANGVVDEAEAETLAAAQLACRILLDDLDDTTGVCAVVLDVERDEKMVYVTRSGRPASTGVRTVNNVDFKAWARRR